MLRVNLRNGTRLSAGRQASRDVFMSKLKVRPPNMAGSQNRPPAATKQSLKTQG